ncbi:hypothetical protein AM501_28950 [Aneurinibacillus migulanus]|uniref:Uncharacterized protein n=1 Tax=Aneurinibacillus migulanus TaxID=47500 RepID=A0A0D1V016_ANEMI|nr:hypothetical protein [Aneurinibacillus migulanus]KIV50184.1 hypothetical protein TS65_30640 [Aneurinibacillus migulanus]KIV52614.1 hypothetical protein TS64_21555 [Aneurinibacillus migulanus]KON96217.1 hypothetical protein AF333_12725 [Aneurinibacillus migulanus]KPD04926.1 hypothetical protein AM501_28950 [Aneurinibacillus migulanus]MED0894494.1 hypothetical protein [Aneurinibacillus migulanus]
MENIENNHQPSFAHEPYQADAFAYPYYAQPISHSYHHGYTHDERSIWPIIPFLFLTPLLYNYNRPKYIPYPYPAPYPSPYPYPAPYPYAAGTPGPYYGAPREE